MVVSLVAVVVCLAGSTPLEAQRYNFKFYGQEEGLQNLAVQVVLQDREGFLWVGTQNGLFRYDGSQFKVFTKDDGLPGARIESLQEAADGTLWVGTATGLARRKGGRFETVPRWERLGRRRRPRRDRSRFARPPVRRHRSRSARRNVQRRRRHVHAGEFSGQ